MKRVLFVCLTLLHIVSCAKNDNSPSNNYPTVSGNYSGTTTISWPELGQTLSCPTTTSVAQNGSQVSIAPLQLRGQCGTASLPLGDTTITTTGSLGSDRGTFYDASCGGNYDYTASGGFFGRSLQASLVYTSSRCYNMNLTVNVSR